MIGQNLTVCYYGSIIEFEFNNLTYALFSSNWLDQDSRYRKIFLIFVEVTNKPLFMEAKIFRINLNSFLFACKNAYSMFALIMNIK